MNFIFAEKFINEKDGKNIWRSIESNSATISGTWTYTQRQVSQYGTDTGQIDEEFSINAPNAHYDWSAAAQENGINLTDPSSIIKIQGELLNGFKANYKRYFNDNNVLTVYNRSPIALLAFIDYLKPLGSPNTSPLIPTKACMEDNYGFVYKLESECENESDCSKHLHYILADKLIKVTSDNKIVLPFYEVLKTNFQTGSSTGPHLGGRGGGYYFIESLRVDLYTLDPQTCELKYDSITLVQNDSTKSFSSSCDYHLKYSTSPKTVDYDLVFYTKAARKILNFNPKLLNLEQGSGLKGIPKVLSREVNFEGF